MKTLAFYTGITPFGPITPDWASPPPRHDAPPHADAPSRAGRQVMVAAAILAIGALAIFTAPHAEAGALSGGVVMRGGR
jgi:hypothetical protein